MRLVQPDLDICVRIIPDSEPSPAYDALWRRLLGIRAPFPPPPPPTTPTPPSQKKTEVRE
jgi:hypothetical protein